MEVSCNRRTPTNHPVLDEFPIINLWIWGTSNYGNPYVFWWSFSIAMPKLPEPTCVDPGDPSPPQNPSMSPEAQNDPWLLGRHWRSPAWIWPAPWQLRQSQLMWDGGGGSVLCLGCLGWREVRWIWGTLQVRWHEVATWCILMPIFEFWLHQLFRKPCHADHAMLGGRSQSTARKGVALLCPLEMQPEGRRKKTWRLLFDGSLTIPNYPNDEFHGSRMGLSTITSFGLCSWQVFIGHMWSNDIQMWILSLNLRALGHFWWEN